MTTAIPALRHRFKSFESLERLDAADGGKLLTYLTPTLDDQINAWVDQTHAQLVDPGRVTIQTDAAGVTRRSVGVTYLSPVEHDHGSKPTPVPSATPAPFKVPGFTISRGAAAQTGDGVGPAAGKGQSVGPGVPAGPAKSPAGPERRGLGLPFIG